MTDWDKGSPQTVKNQDERYGTEYTSIDLNTNQTQDVLAKSEPVRVYYVKLTNNGTTAVVDLEVTDGSTTVKVVDNSSGGNNIEKTTEFVLDSGEKLQTNVTTKEGSSQTDDLVVSFENREHTRDF